MSSAPRLSSAGRVPKPWGYELWFATTEFHAGKILHIDAGHRLSLQYHRRKDESCYLLRGRLRLTTGNGVNSLATTEVVVGQGWRTRPGEVHSIEALEESEVLEVSTPELDDLVRLADRYGRAESSGEDPHGPHGPAA